MITILEALDKILNSFESSEYTETIPLKKAYNRILRRDVISKIDVPPFDNSAMDGYALNIEDLANTQIIPLFQEIFAGESTDNSIPPGKCARIMTGAMIPPGVNLVIPKEKTTVIEEGDTKEQSRIKFNVEVSKVKKFQHIREKGKDIARDTVVLKAGTRLEAQHLSLLASCGICDVVVSKKPTVALLSTGDELVSPPTPLKPGQIYNSNFFFLRAYLEKLGAAVSEHHTLKDDLDSTTEFFKSLNEQIIITCGGVSVGDRDFVKEAFEAAGAKRIFWRVGIKPGKPLYYARRGEQLIFGIPGNPVSTVVSTEIFVRPALCKLLGMNEFLRPIFNFSCTNKLGNQTVRPHVVRAMLVPIPGESKPLQVQLYTNQNSNILSSVKDADVFLFVPPETGNISRGNSFQGIILNQREALKSWKNVLEL
ncbi:gephyrin-like molybdotransferase Glp [Candidatus Riflebacteria bacterium]